MEVERKKKMPPKRIFMIVILCFLSVVLVTLAGTAIWLDAAFFSRLNRPEENFTLSPEEIEDIMGPGTDQVILPSVPVEVIKPGSDVINVLLVGQDRREGETRMHSDAMILCTINKKTNTITMTSFLRDMWVKIPGYGDQRINVSYMFGGFKLLNETIEYNFGASAQYNVEIDFDGFITAIDRVGGIDVTLTKGEADYLNEKGLWDVEPDQDWNLKEGLNHLDGKQALAYSRIRAVDGTGDFGRTERQRLVLSILLEKVKKLSLTELYALVYDLVPMVTTDMTNGEIIGLVAEITPILSNMNLVSQRVPVDGKFAFENINGSEVIVLKEHHFKAARDLLAQTMSAA